MFLLKTLAKTGKSIYNIVSSNERLNYQTTDYIFYFPHCKRSAPDVRHRARAFLRYRRGFSRLSADPQSLADLSQIPGEADVLPRALKEKAFLRHVVEEGDKVVVVSVQVVDDIGFVRLF